MVEYHNKRKTSFLCQEDDICKPIVSSLHYLHTMTLLSTYSAYNKCDITLHSHVLITKMKAKVIYKCKGKHLIHLCVKLTPMRNALSAHITFHFYIYWWCMDSYISSKTAVNSSRPVVFINTSLFVYAESSCANVTLLINRSAIGESMFTSMM